MTFFTVNIETHSLHTVRASSPLEDLLNNKSIGERLTVKVGNERHAVFESAEEARDYQTMLQLNGVQS